MTAVSVEPPGAVARRGLGGRAGYEPLRRTDASTTSGGLAIAVHSDATRPAWGVKGLRETAP